MLIFLGEDEFSYGFDGRGLKAENGQFEEFGQFNLYSQDIECFNLNNPAVPLSVGLPSQSPASSTGQSPIHLCHHDFAFSGILYHCNQTVWTLIFRTLPPLLS